MGVGKEKLADVYARMIGKGMDVKRMMADFLGKATGVCRGNGTRG